MEHARCICTRDSEGKVTLEHFGCAIHGRSSAFPRVPWVLWHNDKKFLRSLRIDPEDQPMPTEE